jgi:hypothetical protein
MLKKGDEGVPMAHLEMLEEPGGGSKGDAPLQLINMTDPFFNLPVDLLAHSGIYWTKKFLVNVSPYFSSFWL